MEYTASRVEVTADVVTENFLQNLFAWFLSVFGYLLESFVGGRKDGKVGTGAIEELNDVVKLVYPLRKLVVMLVHVQDAVYVGASYFGRVFALIDELVYRSVRLVIVMRMMWRSVMRRLVMGRLMVRRRRMMGVLLAVLALAVKEILIVVVVELGAFQPRLYIATSVMDLGVSIICALLHFVKCIVKNILRIIEDVLCFVDVRPGSLFNLKTLEPGRFGNDKGGCQWQDWYHT